LVIYNLAFSGKASISAFARSFNCLLKIFPEGLYSEQDPYLPSVDRRAKGHGGRYHSQSREILCQDDTSDQLFVDRHFGVHPSVDADDKFLDVSFGWVRFQAFCWDDVGSESRQISRNKSAKTTSGEQEALRETHLGNSVCWLSLHSPTTATSAMSS
jgi:hypothetical protein